MINERDYPSPDHRRSHDVTDADSDRPESVRKFPDAPRLAAEMRAAGFSEVSYRYMTMGIVALHIARR